MKASLTEYRPPVMQRLRQKRKRSLWKRAEKVLIVDDEADIVRLLDFNLKYDGYAVKSTYNVKQALEVIGSWRPQAVLIDLTMPELDGFDLLKTIRSTPKFHFVTPIVLSARTLMGEIERALALGAKDYLMKPFDPAYVGLKVWDCIHSD